MISRQKSSSQIYLYGFHAVRGALANSRRKIHNILLALPPDHVNRKILEQDLAQHPNPPHVSETKPGHLDKLVGKDAVHQGLVALVKPLANQDIGAFLRGQSRALPNIAILDQVTDPHNIGAVLRSAAAFGIGALVTPTRHCPGESGLIARVSSGGLEVVPWLRVRNLGDTCEILKEHGYYLSGLAATADQDMQASAFQAHIPQAVIFGSEGQGMRHRTRSLCDQVLRLPTLPPVSDLNVSNAAAITFFTLQQSLCEGQGNGLNGRL